MRNLFLICLLLLIPSQLVWAEEEEEEVEEAPPTISYYQIKPSLVANLAKGGKYIRCDIQLMTKDEAFLESLTLHGPAIRHALLMLLSEQDGKTLKSPDGKEALRKAALTEVKKILDDATGKDAVEALLFTTFFVQ
ncbi:MAG: flagellar basal body-associated FliL family protein [Candidatus Thiodiazotropha lotti]|uniref:Flagellar protein FliL n=1 Tax=Candidatus Thiodiazotropha lotti TaxID=2792787 RepID=A0A9E4MZA1_9GAMM|nr:flagellar basal body-associated FliL family protein [Candidatus Thiodiazotropha lotti]ODB99147.1 flagellar basal body protein FliL [Candidatus Thiodiazotropha endoloripes]MCG7921128.1 flagellar basal body-associated FliL family protein [Candidatus Thiodiazotropha lotti]MCG7929144.1 flagellar basal body-associated FliL family protein [Candidatus Thiodiazotropha lotti]MCG7937309.1 flagellar basal body-associated FliL family protein [Candidatus Thiodiazotropha lotti]